MLNQTNNTNIDLTAQKEHFKLWLATPSNERSPRTQQELAEQIGVHPVTLSKWKDRDFMNSVVELVREDMRQHTADVVLSIVQSAKQGSYQHARLFLEYAERWSKAELPPQEQITLEDLIDQAKKDRECWTDEASDNNTRTESNPLAKTDEKPDNTVTT